MIKLKRADHLLVPEGTKCNAYITQDGKISRCGKVATVVLTGGFPSETWACEECAQSLLQKYGEKE